MLRRRERRAGLRSLLGDELYDRVAAYAASRGISLEEAMRDLVRKGFRYAELEKTYGKRIADREVWDRRFYFLRVEAEYLRYKLRLQEVVEDMRRVLMVLSSTVSELATCSREERLVRELRNFVRGYMDKYIFSAREQAGGEEISDTEVLESIRSTLKRYEELIRRPGTQT